MGWDKVTASLKKTNSNQRIVLAAYEKYLRDKGEQSRVGRGYSHFHPSAFGDCLRKLSYQYYSELNDKYKLTDPVDVAFMRICDAGHAFHHRMQHDLGELGILRGYWKCKACCKIHGRGQEPNPNRPIGILRPDKCECGDKRKPGDLFEYEELFVKSEPEYNLQGHCDGIVEMEIGNPDSRYIIDFKTINENKFQFLKEPDNKYVVQVTIYMWLTDIKKAIIYYEEKNRHNVKEFVIDREDEKVDKIKETAKKLKIVLENGGIPSRNKSYKKDSYPCNWCDYCDICFSK